MARTMTLFNELLTPVMGGGLKLQMPFINPCRVGCSNGRCPAINSYSITPKAYISELVEEGGKNCSGAM